ncbi:MAG TPA: glycine cleavage system aminomethyltransferase GcvT [Bacteroidota bacterium]|nr:glycine cleavage system aminomethyltransferase GcvT [Bacteroidota bacterium]
MKQTAFTAIHRRLGGKLIEFGGYEMPVQYSGIIEEHRCVRNAVGVFDVSHMGEFFVRGADALALIQKITVNDASKLTPGKAQYSAMCKPDGGIVDDLLVYRYADHYMLVVNASNIQKDFEWVRSNAHGMNVDVTDRSDEISLLAIQGPKAIETLQKLTAVNLSEIPYYSFVEGKLAGETMTISRTGYTGEPGFELYFTSDPAIGERIWNEIFAVGASNGIKPVGLGARDTLRLEMGFCLYGNDIDETTNPLEAGLGWITKLDKGEFNGRDVLQKAKAEGLKRRLVGFSLNEAKAFPRHGYGISVDGSNIGTVTSGTISPTLEKGIGMGYVPAQYAQAGSKIEIQIRNSAAGADVVKIPFLKK